MVVMFGGLVVPQGIVSIVLVILQPLAVGAWCTLCLAVPRARPARGKPLWRTFWVGGTLEQHRTIRPADSPATARWRRRSPTARIVAAMDVTNVPWNLLLSAALGGWLMAAPAVLRVSGPAADSNHLAGALVVTWAVIAFGEVARPARLLNIVMGIWTAAAPWLLSGATDGSGGPMG